MESTSRSRPGLFLVNAEPHERLAKLRSGAGLSVEEMDFRGLRLAHADLSGLDLSGFDFSGCDMSGVNLSEAILVRTRLEGAVLFEARLDGAVLASAELGGADCTRASLRRAAFGGARLREVSLFGADLEGAHLSRTDLARSDLRSARLVGAQLRDADLTEADLSHADLSHATVERCDLAGARFRDTNLREARLRDPVGYEEADWIGADVRATDFRGNSWLRRHVVDENYLHELRTGGLARRLAYAVWWATSDCGRSPARWALLWTAVALGFSMAYRLVPMHHPEGSGRYAEVWYSLAALTTLDSGSWPLTPLGHALTIVEVTTGYVLLAALFSIVVAAMGRRGQ